MNTGKRFASLMASVNLLAGSYTSPREPGYVSDYEPLDVKGDPGQYDKLKRMSRSQRKRYKEKLRRKK